MRSTISLTVEEEAMLQGERGPGAALAMRLVVKLASVMGANELLPIVGAHIDSCLFHGQSGLDFVRELVDGQARVTVPTTLNVSSLDLLHPELFQGDDATRDDARALMDAYITLGCKPTWTCAPYQSQQRPALGEHIAWAESNAIVFANSVLGARTHRYGDFIDIAAAITARVPRAGLHLDTNRLATRVVDVSSLTDLFATRAHWYPLLGHVLGRSVGSEVPVIVGLPASTSEDNLKALGAAAASSGSLALFHAVGLTPEASSVEQTTGGGPTAIVAVSEADLRQARADLSTVATGPLTSVSVGTPHYSVAEIEQLYLALGARGVADTVAFYVSTSREVLHEAQLRGWVTSLQAAGVVFVTDTCTYITPIIRDTTGLAMTDSAKWAYYAPGNIGVEAIFASLAECVESAVAGVVTLEP